MGMVKWLAINIYGPEQDPQQTLEVLPVGWRVSTPTRTPSGNRNGGRGKPVYAAAGQHARAHQGRAEILLLQEYRGRFFGTAR